MAKHKAVKRIVSKKRQRITRSLLIVECDVKHLELDSLSIGKDVERLIRVSSPRAKTELVQTTTEAELLSQFGCLAEKHYRYRRIVIIGHSNPDGLQLCSDKPLSKWTDVAKWLDKFEPQQIIAIACKAGQLLPAKALFDSLPSLNEFYASPILTTKVQGYATIPLIAYLLKIRMIETEFFDQMRLANYFLTGGAIWKWTRGEYKRIGVAEAVKLEIGQYFMNRINSLRSR
jgi:hypothetical protein